MNPLATIRANLLACVLGLAAAIFLVISVVQSVEINGFLWIDGLKDKIEDCARDRNELRAIAKQKNEQKAESDKRVKEAEQAQRLAETIADRIERAPVTGDCKTPEIIMGADL